MKKKPSSTKRQELSTLADRVRSARRKASISQTELARRIGVSASAVAQWEHPAGTHPSVSSLIRILEITGVSLDWLVMGKRINGVNVNADEYELPAVSLEFLAHCETEEKLLSNFREMPTKRRSLLLELSEELLRSET